MPQEPGQEKARFFHSRFIVIAISMIELSQTNKFYEKETEKETEKERRVKNNFAFGYPTVSYYNDAFCEY